MKMDTCHMYIYMHFILKWRDRLQTKSLLKIVGVGDTDGGIKRCKSAVIINKSWGRMYSIKNMHNFIINLYADKRLLDLW